MDSSFRRKPGASVGSFQSPLDPGSRRHYGNRRFSTDCQRATLARSVPTILTPPGRPAHGVNHLQRGQLQFYSPPQPQSPLPPPSGPRDRCWSSSVFFVIGVSVFRQLPGRDGRRSREPRERFNGTAGSIHALRRRAASSVSISSSVPTVMRSASRRSATGKKRTRMPSSLRAR